MENQWQDPNVPCVTDKVPGIVLHEPTTRQPPQVEVQKDEDGRHSGFRPPVVCSWVPVDGD